MAHDGVCWAHLHAELSRDLTAGQSVILAWCEKRVEVVLKPLAAGNWCCVVGLWAAIQHHSSVPSRSSLFLSLSSLQHLSADSIQDCPEARTSRLLSASTQRCVCNFNI